MCSSGIAFASSDTAFSQIAFTDVSVDNSFYESIEYLRTQNVVKGYIDGTFRPTTRINRAEFVEFIVNPFILDTNAMNDCVQNNIHKTNMSVFYSDVQRNQWYSEPVCYAKIKNIINGYPDGTFKPATTINFAEAAKIIANVFSMQLATEPTGEFWYRPYVEQLSALNAIPTSIKRFDQALTRQEMAEIVFRVKTKNTTKQSVKFSEIQ